jgi:hypothetical protein
MLEFGAFPITACRVSQTSVCDARKKSSVVRWMVIAGDVQVDF